MYVVGQFAILEKNLIFTIHCKRYLSNNPSMFQGMVGAIYSTLLGHSSTLFNTLRHKKIIKCSQIKNPDFDLSSTLVVFSKRNKPDSLKKS